MLVALRYGSLVGRLGLSWCASVLPVTCQCFEAEGNTDNRTSDVEFHLSASGSPFRKGGEDVKCRSVMSAFSIRRVGSYSVLVGSPACVAVLGRFDS